MFERRIVAPEPPRERYSTVAAISLFTASAMLVVWQTSRLAVLWDVSYILENAQRIAAGDVPYRDFPFPYAPITFLLQATIIRWFGRAYWHHAAYAAIVCGAASALTLTIVRRLLPDPRSILLCSPLAVLGIYCILPNPFYDPDCCFVILLILGALTVREDALLLGAACVVPIFVKQNIGIPFAGAAVLMFALDRRWKSVIGFFAGLAAAVAIVGVAFGGNDYVRWTLRFAAARRLPPLDDILSVYADVELWCWVALIVAGSLVARARWLIAIPFLWMELRFFITDDPMEAEVNLLRVWPVFVVVGLLIAVAAWRRERGGLRIMPFLIISAILGALLSQGSWGSTYGIWPLLVVLIAMVFRFADLPAPIVAIVCIALLHHGAWYVVKNRRLTYVKWDAGAVRRSSLPALRGFSMRGEWLPEFENLVRFTDREIPRNDGILFLPGEDLFYFTTGRRPSLPVVMFDGTVNPYSPEQVAEWVTRRNIRWVIVKERLQINGMPYADLVSTLGLLRGFKLYAALPNYAVYVAAR